MMIAGEKVVRPLNRFSSEQVKQAIARAQKKYHILRMRVAAAREGDATSQAFVEMSTEAPVQMERFIVDDKDVEPSANKWKQWLKAIGSVPRDHTKALVFFEFYTSKSGEHHKLLAVLNHSACDGPGVANVAHAICSELGNVIDEKNSTDNNNNNNNTDTIHAQEFADIFSRKDTDADKMIGSAMPSQYLPPYPPSIPQQDLQKAAAHIIPIWDELDEKTTKSLIQNCHERKCSIQSALSIAGALALAKAMEKTHPLPQVVASQVPVNMRKHVNPPLKTEDCVCGSSALWWSQTLSPDQSIWSSMEEATKAIQTEITNKSAHGWWHRLTTTGKVNAYSLMTSSVGIDPVQTSYGNGMLRVSMYHIMGNVYSMPQGAPPSHMTHVHTFAGKLLTTFNYVAPGYSDEFGQRYAANQQEVFKILASDNSNHLTIAQVMKQLEPKAATVNVANAAAGAAGAASTKVSPPSSSWFSRHANLIIAGGVVVGLLALVWTRRGRA